MSTDLVKEARGKSKTKPMTLNGKFQSQSFINTPIVLPSN